MAEASPACRECPKVWICLQFPLPLAAAEEARNQARPRVRKNANNEPDHGGNSHMRRARSLRVTQVLLAGVLAGVLLLTSACGGDSHLQQQASAAHAQLDQQIKHAESIGVFGSSIQPILQQEQVLNKNSAPFSMFDDTPANTFYKNQTTSYQQLLGTLQSEVAIVTGQDQGDAQQKLQSFKDLLTTQQAQKVGDIQAFSLRYTTDTNLFAAAQTPNDYLAISTDAQNASDALNLLSTTY